MTNISSNANRKSFKSKEVNEMDVFDYIRQTADKSKLTTWLERARKAHDWEVAKAVERRLIELER